MTIENAEFAVQRDDTLFSCKGSELKDKLQYGDLMVLQYGSSQGNITYTRGVKKGEYNVTFTSMLGGAQTWWGEVKAKGGDADGIGCKFPFMCKDASNYLRGDAWAEVIEIGGLQQLPTKIRVYYENFRPDQPFLQEYVDANDFRASQFKDQNNEHQGHPNSNSTTPIVLPDEEFVDGFFPVGDDDLLACTDDDGVTKKVTGAQFKTLFTTSMPWENHDGGIWHVKNATETITLTNWNVDDTFGLFTAWDIDGSNERQIATIEAGKELVFVTDPESWGFFKTQAGSNTANWDFGELTDTSKATDFFGLFARCSNFNGELGGNWDTSNVIDMSYTFQTCTSFNQDLSNWCVSNITSKPQEFDEETTAWTLPRPVWGTCPGGEDQ